jgi:hypothetical protein
MKIRAKGMGGAEAVGYNAPPIYHSRGRIQVTVPRHVALKFNPGVHMNNGGLWRPSCGN